MEGATVLAVCTKTVVFDAGLSALRVSENPTALGSSVNRADLGGDCPGLFIFLIVFIWKFITPMVGINGSLSKRASERRVGIERSEW
jgi:hypothetical protein